MAARLATLAPTNSRAKMDAAAAAEITEDAAENRPLNGDSVDQNHIGSSVEGSANGKYYEISFKLSYIQK